MYLAISKHILSNYKKKGSTLTETKLMRSSSFFKVEIEVMQWVTFWVDHLFYLPTAARFIAGSQQSAIWTFVGMKTGNQSRASKYWSYCSKFLGLAKHHQTRSVASLRCFFQHRIDHFIQKHCSKQVIWGRRHERSKCVGCILMRKPWRHTDAIQFWWVLSYPIN